MTYEQLIAYLNANNVEYRENEDHTVTFVDFSALPKALRYQIYSDMGLNLEIARDGADR